MMRNVCSSVLICAEFGSIFFLFSGHFLGTNFGTALGTTIGRRHVETQLFVSSWCPRFLVPKVVLKSEPKIGPFFDRIMGLKTGSETHQGAH